MRRKLGKAAIAAAVGWLLWLGAAGNAAAAAYTGLYVFGDSLSDVSNIYNITSSLSAVPTQPVSPYSNGRFTNGNVWVQDLSSALGLGAVTPSVRGGNDFAFGGAQTGPTLANPYTATQSSQIQQLTDLPAQVTYFAQQITVPDPNALYTLWIGANDIDALLTYLATNPSLTQQQIKTAAANDFTTAMLNISNSVDALASDGMKNLLALGVPDLGLTPLARSNGVTAQASKLSAMFNTDLLATLREAAVDDGLTLTYADTNAPIDSIVADPSAYGFTNVTDPCWTGSFTSSSSGKLCSTSFTQQNQYLFWDQLHPTAAGHQLVANVALAALVPEPGSAALLLAGVAGIFLIRRRRG